MTPLTISEEDGNLIIIVKSRDSLASFTIAIFLVGAYGALSGLILVVAPHLISRNPIGLVVLGVIFLVGGILAAISALGAFIGVKIEAKKSELVVHKPTLLGLKSKT